MRQPWGTPMTVSRRARLKLVGCLSQGSERRGNKIATRRRLGLRRAATDPRPAKKWRGRSSHLLLDPVLCPCCHNTTLQDYRFLNVTATVTRQKVMEQSRHRHHTLL